MPSRCQFVNCFNTHRTHSLFRFPFSDENRLRIWINNSGNKHLTTLTLEQLKYRTLCEVHFEPCYKNGNDNQARLTGTAIPRHYCEDQSIDIRSVPVQCPVEGNTDLTCLTHEKLKHRFICEDHFETGDVVKNLARARLLLCAVPLKCKVITPQCNEKFTSYPKQINIKQKNFVNRFVNHTNAKRKHLKPMTVPTPYIKYSSHTVSDSLDGSRPPGLCQTKMKVAERKRLIRRARAVRHGIFQDCQTKKYDGSHEIDGYESEAEEDQQCPDLPVLRPNKVYHNYHTQIRAEIAKDSNNSDVRVAENKCTECERPIHGFQWWCAQCPGARCGRCARRMAHRPHHLLRAPAHASHEQTEAILSAIREQLGEDLCVPQAELRHVDENGVDLRVTDEPEVKAEPPEDEDDPLLSNPADPLAYNPSLDPLACNPKVEDPLAFNPSVKDPLAFNPSVKDPLAFNPSVKDPLAFNPSVKDPLAFNPSVKDPLAFNPSVKDPLAFNPSVDDPLECKSVLRDLTSASHQEPSIDYKPETQCLQSLEPLVDPDQSGEPFKPLGVEFYSPVHPGVESYEMSLAQCSGVEDFRCSGWRDPHSVEQDPVDLDGQSNDDDRRPSIKRRRVPTHYTYTGDHSDDSIKEIDYEQPTHSHTETDTEENRTNRPWVQMLSSQEQNTTVITKKHKTQKPRFQLPTSKGQNILAKQQNVQIKRPWVQVFSNKEQKSTAKRKNRRSEQHIGDSICEEQSSTLSDAQTDRRSEQSHAEDSICEEQTSSEQSHSEDSICEEQSSTVSATQKMRRSEQSHPEDPICEEPTSTEQSDAEDSICEEQISAVSEIQKKHNRLERSNTGDSLYVKHKPAVSRKQNNDKQKNRRSEQTPIADPLSEEQTPTVSEIQNSDNTLKLSEIQNSHKEQTSTVTAKRKKKFIVTSYKKRPIRKRTQYPTHIQRDLPTDRQIDVREDTIDINMTTESPNTLLNLEDYIREKVLEYPSDIEELM